MSWRALVVWRPRSSLRKPATACDVFADQPVRERRLADARRADEPTVCRDGYEHEARRGPPRKPRSRARAARRSRRARSLRASGRDPRRDRSCSARRQARRRCSTRPPRSARGALVEVAVHGRDDEEHVDVDGDHLRFARGACGAPQQSGAPLEHVLDRRAVRAVDDGDPVADDGPLELARATRAACRSSPRAARDTRDMEAALPFRATRAGTQRVARARASCDERNRRSRVRRASTA